jgi:hypothetical protein
MLLPEWENRKNSKTSFKKLFFFYSKHEHVFQLYTEFRQEKTLVVGAEKQNKSECFK